MEIVNPTYESSFQRRISDQNRQLKLTNNRFRRPLTCLFIFLGLFVVLLAAAIVLVVVLPEKAVPRPEEGDGPSVGARVQDAPTLKNVPLVPNEVLADLKHQLNTFQQLLESINSTMEEEMQALQQREVRQNTEITKLAAQFAELKKFSEISFNQSSIALDQNEVILNWMDKTEIRAIKHSNDAFVKQSQGTSNAPTSSTEVTRNRAATNNSATFTYRDTSTSRDVATKDREISIHTSDEQSSKLSLNTAETPNKLTSYRNPETTNSESATTTSSDAFTLPTTKKLSTETSETSSRNTSSTLQSEVPSYHGGDISYTSESEQRSTPTLITDLFVQQSSNQAQVTTAADTMRPDKETSAPPNQKSTTSHSLTIPEETEVYITKHRLQNITVSVLPNTALRSTQVRNISDVSSTDHPSLKTDAIIKDEINSLYGHLNSTEAEIRRQNETLELVLHELERVKLNLTEKETVVENLSREVQLLTIKLDEQSNHQQSFFIAEINATQNDLAIQQNITGNILERLAEMMQQLQHVKIDQENSIKEVNDSMLLELSRLDATHHNLTRVFADLEHTQLNRCNHLNKSFSEDIKINQIKFANINGNLTALFDRLDSNQLISTDIDTRVDNLTAELLGLRRLVNDHDDVISNLTLEINKTRELAKDRQDDDFKTTTMGDLRMLNKDGSHCEEEIKSLIGRLNTTEKEVISQRDRADYVLEKLQAIELWGDDFNSTIDQILNRINNDHSVITSNITALAMQFNSAQSAAKLANVTAKLSELQKGTMKREGEFSQFEDQLTKIDQKVAGLSQKLTDTNSELNSSVQLAVKELKACTSTCQQGGSQSQSSKNFNCLQTFRDRYI